MLEEAGVLGGEHRARNVARDAVERHGALLEQLGAVEGREERRIERRLGDRPLVEQEARDLARRELDDEQPPSVAAGGGGRRPIETALALAR